MDARKVEKQIAAHGGELVRQVGSHRRWRLMKDGATCFATVPFHGKRDIPISTLKQIDAQLAPILGKGWLI